LTESDPAPRRAGGGAHSSFDEHDARALARAVELAEGGRGWVEPNPPVGAVAYRGPEVLAEGWHRAWGGLHAERDLLAGLTAALPDDASIAVTLEPCCSHGKQPPCTEALREAGARRVVVGEVDPDPRHEGRGLEILREAGMEVLEAPAGSVPDSLLAEFRRSLGRRRPEVLLKWAADLDGCWAPSAGEDRWVSGEEARAEVHRLRAHVDGILVGSGTVLDDDPRLTARPSGMRPLKRVVLDGRGRLPPDSTLVRSLAEGPVLHVTHADTTTPAGVERLEVRSVRHLEEEVLPALGEAGIARLLVEGGPTDARAFLDAGMVDRAWVFVAPLLFGGEAAGGPRLAQYALAATQRPQVEEVRRIGCDAWFRLHWPSSSPGSAPS